MAVILLSLLLALSVSAQVFVGPQYQSQTNSRKTSLVAGAVFNDSTPGAFPTLGLVELFLEDMTVSFDTLADDMPEQFLGLQRRPKLIHSIGAIALGRWIPYDNPQGYTGIFKGCNNLLIRFSLAKAPTADPKGYAPGISLKCLRTGVPSANLFAMYNLEGQDSWNFFKHDLTNHVPDLSTATDLVLRELRQKFSEASQWPVMLGLTNFAAYDENGNSVSTPVAPFRLIFHPVTSVRNSFSDSPSSKPFENVIADTLKQGPVYYVYAQNHPADTPDKYIKIAHLDLTSMSSTSQFGDVYLFFQHTRMEEDLKLHPDWVPYVNQIIKEQQNTTYYTFPDLPFN